MYNSYVCGYDNSGVSTVAKPHLADPDRPAIAKDGEVGLSPALFRWPSSHPALPLWRTVKPEMPGMRRQLHVSCVVSVEYVWWNKVGRQADTQASIETGP